MLVEWEEDGEELVVVLPVDDVVECCGDVVEEGFEADVVDEDEDVVFTDNVCEDVVSVELLSAARRWTSLCWPETRIRP